MPAFADTGFYVALLSPRDRFHQRAIAASANFYDNVITSEFVLLELGNFLGAFARPSFHTFYETLRRDTSTEIVPASSELFEQAVNLYTSRHDKNWSLTDCSSFVVMNDRGLVDALTFDRHFEQAGFRVLPG